MKLKKTSGVLSIATLAALTATTALADDRGWYLGFNAGQTRAKIDDAKITRGFLSSGFITTSIDDDDRDNGYKVFGGYQFNRYFALEGSQFDLGKYAFTARTLPLGTLNGEIKLKGVAFDAVGILPFTDRFSAFGRAGLNHTKATDSFGGTGLLIVSNTGSSKRDTNYKLGLGLQYAFTDRLGMRVEAERYRINDAVGNKADVDMASIGLVYKFASRAPARYPRVEAAEPIAPIARAPMPEPVIAPPPPVVAAVVRPTKVSFSADSLFDFDKAIVKPAGRQALDKFAADLKGAQYDVITVTGHTDRIGSPQYNLALSSRRAAAVRDYLVQPNGIPSGKIAATGTGESEPVTKPSDCKGEKATPQLVVCLQPDRRVDVEVTGTK
jgi:OOP family OmpA-OmpF porin